MVLSGKETQFKKKMLKISNLILWNYFQVGQYSKVDYFQNISTDGNVEGITYQTTYKEA